MSLDPISSIADLATAVVSRIWPDKTLVQQQQFAKDFQTELSNTELLKGQLAVDAAEAANPNLFVSGPRPYLMWGLSTAAIWYFLGAPVITYFCIISGHPIPPYPVLDIQSLLGLLGTLLGMSGFRTYEKRTNSASNH
jgi:hypothetical protein